MVFYRSAEILSAIWHLSHQHLFLDTCWLNLLCSIITLQEFGYGQLSTLVPNWSMLNDRLLTNHIDQSRHGGTEQGHKLVLGIQKKDPHPATDCNPQLVQNICGAINQWIYQEDLSNYVTHETLKTALSKSSIHILLKPYCCGFSVCLESINLPVPRHALIAI